VVQKVMRVRVRVRVRVRQVPVQMPFQAAFLVLELEALHVVQKVIQAQVRQVRQVPVQVQVIQLHPPISYAIHDSVFS
jgi:hypothetical protein